MGKLRGRLPHLHRLLEPELVETPKARTKYWTASSAGGGAEPVPAPCTTRSHSPPRAREEPRDPPPPRQCRPREAALAAHAFWKSLTIRRDGAFPRRPQAAGLVIHTGVDHPAAGVNDAKVGGHEQLIVEQVDAGGVAHGELLLTGAEAEGLQDVALSGPAFTGDDEVLGAAYEHIDYDDARKQEVPNHVDIEMGPLFIVGLRATF